MILIETHSNDSQIRSSSGSGQVIPASLKTLALGGGDGVSGSIRFGTGDALLDSYYLDLAEARLAGAFLLAETGRWVIQRKTAKDRFRRALLRIKL